MLRPPLSATGEHFERAPLFLICDAQMESHLYRQCYRTVSCRVIASSSTLSPLKKKFHNLSKHITYTFHLQSFISGVNALLYIYIYIYNKSWKSACAGPPLLKTCGGSDLIVHEHIHHPQEGQPSQRRSPRYGKILYTASHNLSTICLVVFWFKWQQKVALSLFRGGFRCLLLLWVVLKMVKVLHLFISN